MNSSSLDNRTKPEEDLESSSLLSNTQNDSSSPALNIEQFHPTSNTQRHHHYNNTRAAQPASNPNSGVSISSTGLKVLGLLAVQNASKNLIMRFAVQDKPDFLYSAAVIGSESTKLFLSICYILFYDKRSFASIITFLKEDKKNAILLTVPATVYNIQQTLEYVALSNLDASVFSVLVQTKLVATAGFAVGILGKHLTKVQVLSLGLLTTGVMLCNMKNTCSESESDTGEMLLG
ncbi:hypothetical protein TL16_g12017 [Triparma laevis f. inornata]|uniref:Uncharacterized protein n=1 Tax=Triparma laevis f. inornata TaxID=1714386 RepID=A0A9W7BQ05_9STRA|nr:hypothetical protein TL16_g12017 [Triparma laevis f. inornata]